MLKKKKNTLKDLFKRGSRRKVDDEDLDASLMRYERRSFRNSEQTQYDQNQIEMLDKICGLYCFAAFYDQPGAMWPQLKIITRWMSRV